MSDTRSSPLEDLRALHAIVWGARLRGDNVLVLKNTALRIKRVESLPLNLREQSPARCTSKVHVPKSGDEYRLKHSEQSACTFSPSPTRYYTASARTMSPSRDACKPRSAPDAHMFLSHSRYWHPQRKCDRRPCQTMEYLPSDNSTPPELEVCSLSQQPTRADDGVVCLGFDADS